jgi:Spy/CpxP family protein refolding chaperone
MDALRRVLQVTLLALGLVSATAWPEGPADKNTPSPGPSILDEPSRASEQEPGAIDPQQSGRHFEAKKRERLIQMLRLDDVTRAKLLERWEQLDKKSQDLRRERREAFSELRGQIKTPESRRGSRKSQDTEKLSTSAGGNEAALKKALDRVYAVEEAMAGLRRERLQIARDLLTPEQQGKFLMLSMKFHKEMLQRLEREQGGLKDKGSDPSR